MYSNPKPKRFTKEQTNALYWRYRKQEPPTEAYPGMNGEVKIVKPANNNAAVPTSSKEK